jgi:hypothetical protein
VAQFGEGPRAAEIMVTSATMRDGSSAEGVRGFADTAGNLRLALVNRSAWLADPTFDESARRLACQP